MTFPFIVDQGLESKISGISHPYTGSFGFLRYCIALELLLVLRKKFIFPYHKRASGVERGTKTYGIYLWRVTPIDF